MKQFMKKCVRRLGFDVISLPSDLTKEEKEIFLTVSPFTLTSAERVVCLIRATKYIVQNRIEGDFVECGVWRGGSMMVVAHMLKRLGDTSRKLYLYDTFAGMSQPTEEDVRFDGTTARELIGTVYKDVYLPVCGMRRKGTMALTSISLRMVGSSTCAPFRSNNRIEQMRLCT